MNPIMIFGHRPDDLIERSFVVSALDQGGGAARQNQINRSFLSSVQCQTNGPFGPFICPRRRQKFPPVIDRPNSQAPLSAERQVGAPAGSQWGTINKANKINRPGAI